MFKQRFIHAMIDCNHIERCIESNLETVFFTNGKNDGVAGICLPITRSGKKKFLFMST